MSSDASSIFARAGGMAALRRVAAHWHDLAVAHPVVGHAFERGFADDHVERLAAYLAEGLGGPAAYTSTFGTGARVARPHAGNGVHPEFDDAGIAVFDQAVDAAGIDDPAAAQALKDYWAWATRGPLNDYPDSMADVPDDEPVHGWGWQGPVTPRSAPSR